MVAPIVRYTTANIPAIGQLRIFDHSTIHIQTRHLSLPRLTIGPDYPPGSEGWDGSEFHAQACDMDPIQDWAVGQDAVCDIRVKNADLEIGVPAKAELSAALKLSPASRVSLSAPELAIHQPIETSGMMVPWDETGYFHLITDQGIVINPSELMVLRMDLAQNLVMSSLDIMMQNADLILRGSSWRAQADHISAENLHLLQDINEDWQPDDGVIWVGKHVQISDSRLDINGSTRLHADQIDLDHTTIHSNAPLSFNMQAFEAAIEAFEIIHQPTQSPRPVFRFSMPQQTIMENATLSICPFNDNLHYQNSTPNKIKSSASIAGTHTNIADLSLSATSLSGLVELETKGKAEINVGSWTIPAGSELATKETGEIVITALSEPAALSYAEKMKAGHIKLKTTFMKNSPPPLHKTDPGTGREIHPSAQLASQESLSAASETRESAAIPEEYGLYAFPNPFNPVTQIQYSLKTTSKIDISVYDRLGRLVHSLADGIKEQGHHRTAWNGADLASGVYFVVLTANPVDHSEPFRQILKMTLLK